MRFIGNKENVIAKIYAALSERNISGRTFFDFFAGTASAGKFFKKKGYQILSSDILYLSYCLQKAYIEISEYLTFSMLLNSIKAEKASLFASPLESVLDFLNQIPAAEGFIYKNYAPGGTAHLSQPRMYVSDDNAGKIDAIRLQIEDWRGKSLLTENEYFLLLACLIESVSLFTNVSGVYAAFQKKWDPRAVKPFKMKPAELILSDKKNRAYWGDSLLKLDEIETDILYLDPPYNARQYAPNYHLIETIARYDYPAIHGVTGMRDYSRQKSSFCNKNTALRDLEKIARQARYRCLLLSYNNEGIMPGESIEQVLSRYGDLEVIHFEYARFKSNNNGEARLKRNIHEQLYILKARG